MVTETTSKIAASAANATIVAHFGAEVEVLTSSGSHLSCHLPKNMEAVATGDKVIFELVSPDKGKIIGCCERKNSIYRGNNRGKTKLLAANVDQMLIVIAPEPFPIALSIDKYLIMALANKIEPIIVVNKTDLKDHRHYQELLAIVDNYINLNYRAIAANTVDGTAINNIATILKNKTSLVVGQSGVGKSSIIKKINNDQSIAIGDLAKSQGKHTTTTSRLYQLQPNSFIIDIPGVNQFEIARIAVEEVIDFFPEIKQAAQHCKFRNCAHHNETGCNVITQIQSNKIWQQRFESFHQLTNQN